MYSVQSNGDDHLYSIDAATGVATDLGLVTFEDAEGLAFAGSTLYAIGGTFEEFWDITTPPGSMVGNTGARNGIDAGLDYDGVNGIMYNVNSGSGGSSLYSIDLATGAATLIGTSEFFSDGLAIDAAGNAYGIDGVFNNSLYSIDLGTGALTLIGALDAGISNVQFGLTFAGDTLYALSSDGNIYTVDTATGAATFIASTTCGGVACDGFEGLAAPSTIPEPASLALLGVALVGLGLSGRRRKRH